MCRSKLMNIISMKFIARDLSLGALLCSMSSVHVQPFNLCSVKLMMQMQGRILSTASLEDISAQEDDTSAECRMFNF